MKATESNGKPAREPRRHYDETFKRHAADLTLQAGRRVSEVARELGVPGSMLYAWRRQYAPQPQRPRTFEEAEAENAQLRAEVVRLQERELVLKKSLGILSETPERGLPKSKR
jgi:transposase-like protein